MIIDNKYSETGSNPYYLNLSSTAKDFSFSHTTSPEYGLLDTLTKIILVENELIIENGTLEQEFSIQDSE